jgi:hypothetical protein
MAHEADIGDLSLSALRLPASPPPSTSSSSTSDRQRPPPSLSFSPPPSDGSPARPLGPLRIPSSPSSSALASPPLSTAVPLAPPLLQTQRTLSRSNSTPRSRSRRNQSHDLSTPPLVTGPPSTAALERWVRAFVVVNFDLDVGPVIERTYPERRWGLGVGENISFSSFPDTSLFAEGRVGWSFKLNDDLTADSKGKGRADRPPGTNGASGEGVRAGEGGGKEDGRLWGFVLFVQRRDGSIKRGYFQVRRTSLSRPLTGRLLQKADTSTCSSLSRRSSRSRSSS